MRKPSKRALYMNTVSLQSLAVVLRQRQP